MQALGTRNFSHSQMPLLFSEVNGHSDAVYQAQFLQVSSLHAALRRKAMKPFTLCCSYFDEVPTDE